MEDNILEATASLRNLNGSARKARLVLDLIRGKRVYEAKNILQFSNKRMATHIHKLLNSACANATQAEARVDVDNLIIDKAFADGGPTRRKWLSRAKGSATTIHKRSCHITIGISRI